MLSGNASACRFVGTVFGCSVLLAACATQPLPPPQQPAPVVISEPPTPAPAVKPVKSSAEHRRDFMSTCARRAINSPDYCECAWGEFRKEFTDDEMQSGDLPAGKIAKVKGQVAVACSSLLPEENVRADFTKVCIGTKPELKPYCDCTWSELRKRFSTAELDDDATVASERFVAARAPVVKACGARMPESVSKEAFMKGCTKGDATVDKYCGCAWKELRKQASPAEIESGTFDQKTLFTQVDRTCGKLRPVKTAP